MRKNGFTLIELLAVMVVLAIIALIATPIIIEIVEDAEDESEQRSIELYASAIKNAVATYQLTNANAPKSFGDLTIQYDGDVECTIQALYSDGSFYLERCKVNDGEKEYNYGVKQNNGCVLEDKDKDGKVSFSDVVTCGTESFYVMKNDGTNITMLAMYNLNVGDKANTEGVLGIQNESVKGNNDGYGGISFSNKKYWIDNDYNLLTKYGSDYPAYVYDENSNLHQYINEYERILKEDLKVSSAKASLINIEQFEELGCWFEEGFEGEHNDQFYRVVKCSNLPSWVSTTQYWTGISFNGFTFCRFENSIEGTADCESVPSEYDMDENGIRPVVTISTNDIR